MKYKSQWSRRELLTTLNGAGAAMMLNPLLAWAADEVNPDRRSADAVAQDQVDPRVAAIVAKTIGIDTHNHIDVPFTAAEVPGLARPGPNVDLAGELKKSGLSAICMTFAVDRPALRNPGDAYERVKNGLASMDRLLESNNMKRSLNLGDLRAAHTKRQPTVIQSIEGGHFLEGYLERLEEAYKRGLRHLGLLHDNDASVPLGDVYTNPAKLGGLTAFGAKVIKECNRLGILVDLAHASNVTANAALKMATRPVIISHTSLNTQLGQNPVMANMMRPRLITKEQAKIVADAGGVIGVWTHLADTPLLYAQNIRALVEVIGIDHVCLGTDTKLTPSYRPPDGPGPQPGGGNAGSPPRDTNAQNGPGGSQNRGRPGERTNYAWADQTVGFYYAVVDAMLKVGFTEDEIGKVGGGNFCRVFDAATATHR